MIDVMFMTHKAWTMQRELTNHAMGGLHSLASLISTLEQIIWDT